MKYLIATAVVLLIVVVPLGSWYYLQRGLDYRRDLMLQLKPKGVVDDVQSQQQLKGSTTLWYNATAFPEYNNQVVQIYQQYKDASTFQLLIQGDVQEELKGFQNVVDSRLSPDTKHDWSSIPFAIMDTSYQIRNVYSKSDHIIQDVVSHLAVVLPRPKDKDIKMKDGSDIDAKPKFMQR